jgi:hypothetical protein
MRDSTSVNTKRAKQAQPQQWLEGTPSFESAAVAGPGLTARDATLRGGALSGLLLDGNAAEPPVDVLCTCGTALSKARPSIRDGPSWLVGRVPESGYTVGEPIVLVQSRTATAVRRVFTGAGALRVVDLVDDDDVATTGDVAAGAGRDIAGFAR